MGENMKEDAHTKEKAVGRAAEQEERGQQAYAHMKQTGDFKKNKRDQRFIVLS